MHVLKSRNVICIVLLSNPCLLPFQSEAQPDERSPKDIIQFTAIWSTGSDMSVSWHNDIHGHGANTDFTSALTATVIA